MAWYYYGTPAASYSFDYQGDFQTQTSHTGSPSTSSNEDLPVMVSSVQNEEPKRITYTLKILNPSKKSKFIIHKIRRHERFQTPNDLRQCIRNECGDNVPDNIFDVGYYKGQRGTAKVWIKDEEDIRCMYQQLCGTEANLWCDGLPDSNDVASDSLGKKRKSTNQDGRVSKRQAIREEVDELFEELKEKHGSKYTAAQLRLWANMLQVGTHRDLENPPSVPMFGVGHTPKKGTLNEALTSIVEGVMRALKPPQATSTTPPKNTSMRPALDEIGVSPGKCAVLRSQCIEQLKELHKLLELTAITKEEYDAQKANILTKMNQL